MFQSPMSSPNITRMFGFFWLRRSRRGRHHLDGGRDGQRPDEPVLLHESSLADACVLVRPGGHVVRPSVRRLIVADGSSRRARLIPVRY